MKEASSLAATVLTGWLCWLVAACAAPGRHEPFAKELSPEKLGAGSDGELARVQATTIVPDVFAPSFASEIELAARQVPAKMVAVAEVRRPRAEMRSGPGPQFEVIDRLLQKAELVLVFGSVGVWRRVLLPSSWQRGWVHMAALSETKLNGKAMTIEMNELPTVLATRTVKAAHRYPDMAAIAVHIPKGTMFRSLQKSKSATLVWMPETNSVMWLAEKDAQ